MQSNGQNGKGGTGVESYVDLPYAVVVEESELSGNLSFTAYHPELRGCRGQGWTREEAAADLNAARRDLIETLLERGYPVPLPAEQIAAQAA